MPKRFSLAQARSLLPQVDSLLRDALAAKSAYDDVERAIQTFGERVMMMGGIAVDREQVIERRSLRDSSAARLRSAIEEVQELGCVIKDLDIGLVDFPTFFRGVEVYLCWKLGEPDIAFWHGVDEGFRGRKAIDQDFRDHHRGDRAQ
ncbi:MAG TPA: DUF2203 domain-containing protein [Bryobacteraceae bacterium]|nr:conserved hypothetical protein [Candidatus Sulfopaludibacter sp. SbA4]HYW42377.1 DUF2203 domain-containing protein [Bryobacteraceae bacterium]